MLFEEVKNLRKKLAPSETCRVTVLGYELPVHNERLFIIQCNDKWLRPHFNWVPVSLHFIMTCCRTWFFESSSCRVAKGLIETETRHAIRGKWKRRGRNIVTEQGGIKQHSDPEYFSFILLQQEEIYISHLLRLEIRTATTQDCNPLAHLEVG